MERAFTTCPRAWFEEAANPKPAPVGKPSEDERRDQEYQKEVEQQLKELETICRSRGRFSDNEMMLPLEWECELDELGEWLAGESSCRVRQELRRVEQNLSDETSSL